MTNKELTRVTYIFVTLFLVLMGYLVYFNVVKSKEVVNSTYNIRQDLLATVCCVAVLQIKMEKCLHRL